MTWEYDESMRSWCMGPIRVGWKTALIATLENRPPHINHDDWLELIRLVAERRQAKVPAPVWKPIIRTADHLKCEVGHNGDFAMSIELVVVESASERRFYTKDGCLVGRHTDA